MADNLSNLKKYLDLLFRSIRKTPQEQMDVLEDVSRRGFLTQILDITVFALIAKNCCSLSTNYSQFLPDLGDPDRSNLSPQDATFLGQQIINGIRNQRNMLLDYDLIAYLNSIGSDLASYSSLIREQNFTFYALEGKDINAFALPGGYICIYNGLVYTTQSEAELAGVISHEIGHVVQHHIFRNISIYNRNQWLALAGLITGALLAPINPGAAVIAANSGQGIAIQNILAFSRDFEREADRVGQVIMYNAGFDARAMPSFFAKLENLNKFNNNDALAFLQTHPVTLERLSAAQLRANQLPVKIRPDSKSFLLMREKCRVRNLGDNKAIIYYHQTLKNKRYADINVLYYGFAFANLLHGSCTNTLLYLNKIHDTKILYHPAYYALKAASFGNLGKYKEANQTYEAGLSLFPSYKGLWVGKVDLAINTKNFKIADSFLTTLSNQYPLDIDVWSKIAFIHSDTNLNNPQKYFYALGNQQYILGNYKAALLSYQRALKNAPKSNDGMLNDIISSKIIDIQQFSKSTQIN